MVGMVLGINHITFSVRDLDASFVFYSEVLGMRPVARWYKGAYLQAGSDWVCLTLDEEAREESLPEYTHAAFTVTEEEFGAAVERLRAAGAGCWQENHSEGKSFYFVDPNGHKMELHVGTLESRMKELAERSPRELVIF